MSAQPTNTTAPDLVNIEIDGVPLQAPKGSMIIHAADKAGIPIPRFCYHDKLPIAANCRMCLVDVEKAPKPMPACASPVMEGMKVFTQSKRALDAQRNVMEFLLINHPLDCPVCDQGGECELQDVSVGYGRYGSRYVERKRVVADEDLGPLVATEMTRCIHCTRCVRTSAEICGTHELGGMQRGERLEIGTFDGKPLESELSGNVIDVCPVGALTNKVFRFKARPWELMARPSVGYHDALGSNLFHHVRRGEILRSVPRDNDAINECWLSDRDRYAHEGLYADDRVGQPMRKVDGEWRAVGWDEALGAAVELLRAQPGDALGLLVHPSTSNEEGTLLRRLADALGSGHIDHRLRTLDFADAPVAEAAALPAARFSTVGAALLLGSNLRHEVPLLAQRLRQAAKRGARVFALNPVQFDQALPMAGVETATPSALPGLFAGLAKAAGASLPAALDAIAKAPAFAEAAIAALRGASESVIVLGDIAEQHPQASLLRAAARALAEATGAALVRLPQGANALGLARHGVLPGGLDAQAMLAQPRKAYVLYGAEPPHDFADGAVASRALAGARVLAFGTHLSGFLRDAAELFLPVAALPESDATLVNMDGVSQTVQPAGKAPGDARQGWTVLRALGGLLAAPGFEFTDLTGLRVGMAAGQVRSGTGLAAVPAAAQGLERITTVPIYRGDAVLRRAGALNAQRLNRGACAVLHPEDALANGLSEGAVARFGDGRGTAALPVRIDSAVPRGAVWVESCHDATAPLAPGGALTVTRA